MNTTFVEDPLKLYLRQIAEIPLLSREEEIRTGKTIERERAHFRESLLRCTAIRHLVQKKIQQLKDGDYRIEREMEFSKTGGRSKEEILARLEPNLNTINVLEVEIHKQFLSLSDSDGKRTHAQGELSDTHKEMNRRTDHSIALTEELSLDTSTYIMYFEKLLDAYAQVEALTTEIESTEEGSVENEGLKTTRQNILSDLGISKLELQQICEATQEHYDSYEGAKRLMTQSNLRLVVAVAKKYQNRGMTLADLIAEGNIGLMRASEKYEVERGFKFCTYATWWIRQRISRACIEQRHSARLTSVGQRELTIIYAGEKNFWRKHGRTPTPMELSEETGLSEATIMRIQSFSRSPLSVDSPAGKFARDDSDPMKDTVVAPEDSEAEESDYHLHLKSALQNLLGTLNLRQREIIKLRYGLDDGYPYTLEEVGKIYSITRERVRQIEAKAIQKLQLPWNLKELETFQEIQDEHVIG